MKEKFKEYRGFWYKETEEDGLIWTISRENDGSGDVWYYNKDYNSLDEAIDKISQFDYFDEVCKNIVNKYGIAGFIKFSDYIVSNKSYTQERQ